MAVTLIKSSIVVPLQIAPQRNVWTSNMDLVVSPKHTFTVYFYKWDGTPNFFCVEILKEALSKTLVPFYPMAGRLKRAKDGRIEIDCNGEGALFIEAISDSEIDDFGDFVPKKELEQFIPLVNYYGDISSHPPLLLQVTRFKCGGVCLGFGIHHTIADGASSLHFIKSFYEIARGHQLTLLPSIDRSPLRGRNSPSPFSQHIEYQSPPSIKAMQTKDPSPLKTSIFKISQDQLNQLKTKAKPQQELQQEGSNMFNFTTYEILAAHLWRCGCKARALPDDQESMLYIPVDGRTRLRPPLPPGYFGNVIYRATATAFAGDLRSKPLHYLVGKIKDAIVRMDDDYMRSVLDFVEVQPNATTLASWDKILGQAGAHMLITSWLRLPLYDADFGWGRPIYMGPVRVYHEGHVFILGSPCADDRSLSIAISLQSDHMLLFEKLLYDFE